MKVKIDEELFCRRMMNERGWSFDKARGMWCKFEARKDGPDRIGRDSLGPVDTPLRLHLPGKLFGMDTEVTRNKLKDAKSLQIGMKRRKMSAAEQDQIKSELSKGLNHDT